MSSSTITAVVLLTACGLACVRSDASEAKTGGQELPGEVLALDAASDGKRIDVVLALRDLPHDRLVHRRSSDGGQSFGEEHAVDLGGRPMHAPHRGMDPQIAADGDRLLVVWTTPGSSSWGIGPMATSFSKDGGLSWTPGPTPADDGRTDGHNYIDAVVDSEGRFQVVWLDTHDDHRGLSTSRSRDGRTWSPSRRIDDHTCECCWNRLYPGPRGSLWVLYRDKGPTDLVTAVSRDGGESWQRQPAPGGFGWQFDGCPHVGGALARSPGALHALTWTGMNGKSGLWAVTSTDGGKVWSAPQRLGSEEARRADLAAVAKRLVAVWDEGSRIFGAWSSSAGDVWGPPQMLSDPERRATHPIVVAGLDGAVVLWTERDDKRGWTWVARPIHEP